MPDYFIYSRKSSEAEDRQVLSIESQITELTRLAEARRLRVCEILTETRSAKEPGRPVFQAMMQRISRGEAQGIICWKLDRLARNPIDGGAIIWALKQNGLEIVTPTQTFRQSDDTTILTYIEFGMAQKYVDDLSRNVKRGLRTKAEKGWYPSVAPLGYLNNKHKEKGEHDLLADPERFHLVRQMWDLMLTGRYTLPRIVQIANQEWHFRTRPMKKLGGKPIWPSTLHKIFTSAFYYGWFEYPRGSGKWYQGSHPAMISEEEYYRVQVLLGRKGKPRPVRHTFAFTGLIRCGECGRMITAEEKHQLICSICRTKFAYRRREQCPDCSSPIAEIRDPTILRYEYYHCTKTRRPRCTQRVVTGEELETQIVGYLARIEVSDRVLRWAKEFLDEFLKLRCSEGEKVRESQRTAYDTCLRRLENLINLKTSPRNTDDQLLSDDEYQRQRTRLLKEKARLETLLAAGLDPHRAIQAVTDTLSMSARARAEFQKGSPETKRRILVAVGSNLTLSNKKLNIDAKIPFRIITDSLTRPVRPSSPIEPKNRLVKSGQSGDRTDSFTSLRGSRYDVRTWKGKVRAMVRKLLGYFLEHPNEPALTFGEPPLGKFPTDEAA